MVGALPYKTIRRFLSRSNIIPSAHPQPPRLGAASQVEATARPGAISQVEHEVRRRNPKPLDMATCPARSSAAQRGLFEHGVCRHAQGLDKRSQYETCIFKGGPARNRAVFINSGRIREEKESPPNHKNAANLAFFLCLLRDRQLRGRENTLRGTPVDENRPISGRLERFFCHKTEED